MCECAFLCHNANMDIESNVLNLNLTRDQESGNDQLSIESEAILALLSYCDLQVNVHLKCVCFRTFNSNEPVWAALENLGKNAMNSKFKFVDLSEDINLIETIKEPNVIFVRSLNENDNQNVCVENLNDITLPSFIKRTPISIHITGLASIYRSLVKLANSVHPTKNYIQLLGFRSNCLKACSEVSKWTYLCEVISLKLFNHMEDSDTRTKFFNTIDKTLQRPLKLADRGKVERKRRQSNQNSNIRFMEDFFITISDLILFFFVYESAYKSDTIRTELKTNYQHVSKWFVHMSNDQNIKEKFLKSQSLCIDFCYTNEFTSNEPSNFSFQETDLIEKSSRLYHQLKLEKEECGTETLIDELTRLVHEKFQIRIPFGEQNTIQACSYENEIRIDWSKLSPHANPQAGDLPKNRVERKCQQIENFYYLFRKEIHLKRNEHSKPLVVVDFCSGGGHLGIFLAYMFPDCQFKMIENKEESHELAIKRINLLGIKNCHVYKGNLKDFIGKFDVGLAIHACGTLTDLIIEKCVQSKADILIAPCCYGSIKPNEVVNYPRSQIYLQAIKFTRYYEQSQNEHQIQKFYHKLANYADRTEKNKQFEEKAYVAMSIMDSDRLLYLRNEKNYEFVQLNKMLPENCTTKNNILFAKYKNKPVHS